MMFAGFAHLLTAYGNCLQAFQAACAGAGCLQIQHVHAQSGYRDGMHQAFMF